MKIGTQKIAFGVTNGVTRSNFLIFQIANKTSDRKGLIRKMVAEGATILHTINISISGFVVFPIL